MTPKEVGEQWFERVWNKRDESAIQELMAANAVSVSETGPIIGRQGFVENLYRPFLGAFPDIIVRVDRIVAEGNQVMISWTAIGTNTGSMAGLPATGLEVSFPGMSWARIENEKIAEAQDSYNLHALVGTLSTRKETAQVQLLV